MKTSTRIALLSATAAGWAGSVALLKIMQAPAVGAAVVKQMAASDASYLASLGLTSAWSMATGAVTALFGVAAIVILRIK